MKVKSSVQAALLLSASCAHAGFVSATWTDIGIPPQESFVALYAIGASDGPQLFSPLLSPSVTTLHAGNISEPAQIDATLTFVPDALGIDFTRLDRRARDTYTNGNGAFVFSVTETTNTIAAGSLSLLSPGIGTENGLWARFFDYTTQEFLFQSSQYDAGHDATYFLGGLVGNRGASFSGSLENTLFAGHIYRFDYLIQSGKKWGGGCRLSCHRRVFVGPSCNSSRTRDTSIDDGGALGRSSVTSQGFIPRAFARLAIPAQPPLFTVI